VKILCRDVVIRGTAGLLSTAAALSRHPGVHPVHMPAAAAAPPTRLDAAPFTIHSTTTTAFNF
jgi:hypothetical protein